MPPKKKTKSSASTKKDDQDKTSYVFVLIRSEYNHACDMEPKVMGVYASKDVAARVAGSLDTESMGTFDEALDEYENNYEGTTIDNRKTPPDYGVLLQAGHEDEGEGDRIILEINKMPLVTKTNLKIKERKVKDSDDDSDDDDDGAGFGYCNVAY